MQEIFRLLVVLVFTTNSVSILAADLFDRKMKAVEEHWETCRAQHDVGSINYRVGELYYFAWQDVKRLPDNREFYQKITELQKEDETATKVSERLVASGQLLDLLHKRLPSDNYLVCLQSIRVANFQEAIGDFQNARSNYRRAATSMIDAGLSSLDRCEVSLVRAAICSSRGFGSEQVKSDTRRILELGYRLSNSKRDQLRIALVAACFATRYEHSDLAMDCSKFAILLSEIVGTAHEKKGISAWNQLLRGELVEGWKNSSDFLSVGSSGDMTGLIGKVLLQCRSTIARRTGLDSQAAEQFKKAYNEDLPIFMIQLAQIEHRMGDIETAMNRIESAVTKKSPESDVDTVKFWATYTKCRWALSANDHKTANKLLEDIVCSPVSPDMKPYVRILRARLEIILGNSHAACAHLQAALNAADGAVLASLAEDDLLLAELYKKIGKPEAAIEHLDKFLSQRGYVREYDARAGEAYRIKANCYLLLGKDKLAEEASQFADMTNEHIVQFRGGVLAGSNQLD